MNKLAKGFLIALAAVMVIALLAVLGINLYVESESVRARLETAFSHELRMPVKLNQVHFSLWGGLRVVGVSVPPPKKIKESKKIGLAAKEDFLKAPEISARVAWGPLFSRRLVVRELIISSPTVVWVQARKGKWVLPKAPRGEVEPKPGLKDKEPGAKPGEFPESPRSTEPEPTESTASAEASEDQAAVSGTASAPESAPKKKLEFRIAAARIENATFRFLDREGRPLAVLEGVTVNCPVAATGEAKGTVTIRKLTLHNRVTVENLTTPFAYSKERLELPQIDARLAGGSIRGAYVLKPVADKAPFTLDLLFDGVDLHRLLTETGSDETAQKSEGLLQGSLDLYGESGQQKTMGGVGRLTLRGGRMEQNSLLQMIGQALQIDELTRLELQQAQLDLRVGEGRVYVDSLVLESANLSLTAQGETLFDGKLDLDAALAVNPKISRQLPRWIDANFRPVEGSDRRMIDFAVTGTLERPETDLMRVIVGEKLEKQAMDLFQAFRSLTGGNKPSPKKKKKGDSGEHKSGDKKKATDLQDSKKP